MRKFKEFTLVQNVYNSIFDGEYNWVHGLMINESALDWEALWGRQHKYKWHEVAKKNGFRDEEGNSLELTTSTVGEDEYNLPKMIALFNEIDGHHKNGDEDKAKLVWQSAFKRKTASGKLTNTWLENIVLKGGKKVSFKEFSKTQSKGEGIVEVKMSPAERTARQEALGAIAMMFANSVEFGKKGGNPIQLSDIERKLDPMHRIDNWKDRNGNYEVDNFVDKFIKPLGKDAGEVESLVGRSMEKLMEFVFENPEWLDVTLKTIRTTYNSLLKRGSKAGVDDNKKFEVHRGSPLMTSIYAAYKHTAKLSGIDSEIIKDDKWNPGDVWMVEQSKRDQIQSLLKLIISTENNSPRQLWTKIKTQAVNTIGINDRPSNKDFKNLLHLYNWLIEQLFDKDLLKGVSLKKIGTEGSVKNYNENQKEDDANIIVKFDEFNVKNNDPLASKDVYLNFTVDEDGEEHSYEMQIRTFDKKFQAVQGEIKGSYANHGKVGLGVMKFLFGINSKGKFYYNWRKLLKKVIERGIHQSDIPDDTELADIASRESGGPANVGRLYKENKEAVTKRLLANVLMLHEFVFQGTTRLSDSKWDRFYKKHKNTSIFNIISKLQALELCAWIIFQTKDKRNLLMKRLYFYASSRGATEAGAFSSKFLKIS